MYAYCMMNGTLTPVTKEELIYEHCMKEAEHFEIQAEIHIEKAKEYLSISRKLISEAQKYDRI